MWPSRGGAADERHGRGGRARTHRLADSFADFSRAKGDARQVVADVHARYFGTELNDQSLTPGDNPHIGATSFEAWIGQA